MTWAGAAARFIVGAVLLASGLHKASAPPEEFAVVVEAYQLLPLDLILPFASFLPFLEILLGLALLAGYLSRAAAAAAGGLFLVFIAALASTVLRGIPLENCGCFGAGFHLAPWQAMALDSLLVCLSYLGYRTAPRLAPLDAWVSRGR